MKLAMVGLGRMGMNMSLRLLGGGHQVVAFNRSPEKTRGLAREGAQPAFSLAEAIAALEQPRVVWIMLPAGKAVDDTLSLLEDLLSPGDIIVEGGNSYYRDDIRRAQELEAFGITYLDAGVSGGIWGLRIGYCIMVGGSQEGYAYVEPLLKTLSPEEGYMHCGSTGSGHFMKMVHNGIEYGMMEAYGEGFEILEKSPYGKELDLASVAHLWNQGSVIRSWLLELAEAALREDPRLDRIAGRVEDSGEGRWTIQQALETAVPAPVITMSLYSRFRSRMKESFSDKLVSALRKEFGGHPVAPGKGKGKGRGSRT